MIVSDEWCIGLFLLKRACCAIWWNFKCAATCWAHIFTSSQSYRTITTLQCNYCFITDIRAYRLNWTLCVVKRFLNSVEAYYHGLLWGVLDVYPIKNIYSMECHLYNHSMVKSEFYMSYVNIQSCCTRMCVWAMPKSIDNIGTCIWHA